MLDYLAANHGNRPSINENERAELEFLRKEIPRLKNEVAQFKGKESDSARTQTDTEDESDDEEDEVFELEVQKKIAAGRKPRTSVSAEAFGIWNKKEDFKAPFFPKSDDVKTTVKKRLEQAFMFSALNP